MLQLAGSRLTLTDGGGGGHSREFKACIRRLCLTQTRGGGGAAPVRNFTHIPKKTATLWQHKPRAVLAEVPIPIEATGPDHLEEILEGVDEADLGIAIGSCSDALTAHANQGLN